LCSWLEAQNWCDADVRFIKIDERFDEGILCAGRFTGRKLDMAVLAGVQHLFVIYLFICRIEYIFVFVICRANAVKYVKRFVVFVFFRVADK
jgi:hypothetical protein